MKTRNTIRAFAGALLAVCLLPGAELQGVVKFGGLPLPGATVTVTGHGKTHSTVTGLDGSYAIGDLADGPWRVRIEMLCFVPQERDVSVATPQEWSLEMQPAAEIKAVAAPATYQRAEVAQVSKKEAPPQQQDSATAAELNEKAADGFLVNGSTNNAASSIFSLAPAFGNTRKGQRSLYNGSLGVIAGNSTFDARSYSLTGQDTPKPSYSHLTGMLAFGGPIRIPHLLHDGPMLTVNYQWTRDRNATTQSALMPTALERAGDFSQSVGSIKDPLTGTPFAGNRIPTSRISPQASSLLRLYPLPNFDGIGHYNFQLPLVSASHQDNLQSRVQKSVGRRDQISGGLAWQSTRSDSTNLFGFLDNIASSGINANVNWRHNLAPRLSLSIGYQFSRMSTTVTPYFAGRENVSSAAGITGGNQDTRDWGPPRLNFTNGIASLSDAIASTTHNETNALSVAAIRNAGRHNLAFGGDLRRQQFNLLQQQDPRGTFTFNGTAAGSDFAGFLLGVPDTSSIAYGNADKYFRAWANDAYVTDDWRVTPGLTINAGVRWEYGSPITELYGRLVNLDIRTATPMVARDSQRPLIEPVRNAFQPRVALSWRPMAASSTVIRLGYGVYYNTSVYTQIAMQMAQQAPLSKSLSVQNSATNPLTLADGFRASSGTTATTFAVDPRFRIGYVQSWQASIQRDLPGALVVLASYLGARGTRGMQMSLPNTFPSGADDPCPSCPRGFSYLSSNGNSIRHSGQLQVRRRLRAGLTASVQYTFAKSIDDAAFGGRGQTPNVIAQDWLNPRAERGLSNFDQRHNVNAQVQYTTNSKLGRWIHEWTFGAQVTAGSGLPLTPIVPAAVAGTGVIGSIRPDVTGAPIYQSTLNPAAFAVPTGHWGNAGRNTITGPAQLTSNASVGRVFRFGDRLSADFRVDAANPINHPTYTAWQTNITSAQFGLPTGVNAMRSLQSTLRVRF